MENDFLRQQQAAIERMKQMNAKSAFYLGKNQKSEPEEKEKNQKQRPNFASENKAFSLPFLDTLLKEKDTTLILGLLLILMSEKSDKLLLFALVYILL